MAWAKPGPPLIQSATNDAKANRSASAASTSAAPKVTSTGTTSSKSARAMMMASAATASEKTAIRRAQMANREGGSSNTRRRDITKDVTGHPPAQMLLSASHSGGVNSALMGDGCAIRAI